MSTDLEIHWWDAPGRGAEPARLALTLAGVAFKDVRYAFSDREAAAAARAQSPFGQMPFLKVDGQVIAQSNTILRYVGRLCSMLPTEPLAAAKIEVCDDTSVRLKSFTTEDARGPKCVRPKTMDIFQSYSCVSMYWVQVVAQSQGSTRAVLQGSTTLVRPLCHFQCCLTGR